MGDWKQHEPLPNRNPVSGQMSAPGAGRDGWSQCSRAGWPDRLPSRALRNADKSPRDLTFWNVCWRAELPGREVVRMKPRMQAHYRSFAQACPPKRGVGPGAPTSTLPSPVRASWFSSPEAETLRRRVAHPERQGPI